MSAIPAGTKLGRYEIRSKIGEGGMGEVYRAYDSTMNRGIAIRLFARALIVRQDSLASFQPEPRQ